MSFCSSFGETKIHFRPLAPVDNLLSALPAYFSTIPMYIRVFLKILYRRYLCSSSLLAQSLNKNYALSCPISSLEISYPSFLTILKKSSIANLSIWLPLLYLRSCNNSSLVITVLWSSGTSPTCGQIAKLLFKEIIPSNFLLNLANPVHARNFWLQVVSVFRYMSPRSARMSKI